MFTAECLPQNLLLQMIFWDMNTPQCCQSYESICMQHCHHLRKHVFVKCRKMSAKVNSEEDMNKKEINVSTGKTMFMSCVLIWKHKIHHMSWIFYFFNKFWMAMKWTYETKSQIKLVSADNKHFHLQKQSKGNNNRNRLIPPFPPMYHKTQLCFLLAFC